MTSEPWYQASNLAAWDAGSDAYQARHGDQLEKSSGAAWGVWQIPEAQLEILGEVRDRDVLELGCGAAQWSLALARRGARVTGLDLSPRQLEHARRNVAAAGLDLPLVQSGAETTPFPDAGFDIVFCDHGALSFADPRLTIPEAARILRPGGLLAFSTSTPFLDLCWAADSLWPGRELLLEYWGLRDMEDDEGMINFQLPYGTWIRLFAESGLVVESLVELRPEADATSSYRDEAAREWARRWPMEHIWRARKRA